MSRGLSVNTLSNASTNCIEYLNAGDVIDVRCMHNRDSVVTLTVVNGNLNICKIYD